MMWICLVVWVVLGLLLAWLDSRGQTMTWAEIYCAVAISAVCGPVLAVLIVVFGDDRNNEVKIP